MQEDTLLKLLDNTLRLCLVGLLEVTWDIKHPSAISDRYHDTLVHMSLILIYLLDDRLGNSLYTLCLTVEVADGSLEGILCEHVSWLVDKLFVGERNLHREHMHKLFLHSLIVTGVLDDIHYTVPDDV